MVFSFLTKVLRRGRPGKDVENEKIKKISEFRIAFPQFLACTAKNLVLLELAMAIQYPTIVIPIFLEAKNGLTFTKEQASWFGSIIYICQPVGSIASGYLSEAWGRKRTLIFVNIPFLLGWVLMYTASNLHQLFAGAVILGLSIGLTEAPTLNYIGEISHPKWRGSLVQYSQIYVSFGYFLTCLLGTITDWRMTAAIACSIPILATIIIFFMPESPAWLLVKGREEDAKKSLCWLRGWVTPEDIKEELEDLVEGNKILNNLQDENLPENLGRTKKILRFLGFDVLLKNEILRPFILVNVFFIFEHVAGITGTRPYMVEIFEEFGSPMDPFWAAVVETAVGILANLLGCLTIAKIGKRVICHISFLGGASCCIVIAIYGYSFASSDASWIPVTLYFLFNFVWTVGIGLIPWILLSEIFPIRGRGVASGISSGFAYFVSFVVTKTYYDLTSALTLPGSFAFYGATMIIGWFFFYFFIPETENKSLEEVQKMYANVLKKQNHQCRPGKDCPRLSAIAMGNIKY